jgi:hypothetical protein
MDGISYVCIVTFQLLRHLSLDGHGQPTSVSSSDDRFEQLLDIRSCRIENVIRLPSESLWTELSLWDWMG